MFDFPAHSEHIFNVHAIVEGAMLSKEPLWRYTLLIQDVHQRNRVFGQRGRKNDNFEVLGHLVNEFNAPWAHVDVNVVDAAFNVNWKHDVGVFPRRRLLES